MFMKRVIVASGNPVKIKATKAAFKKVFPDERIVVEGVMVNSGINEQPMGDEDTYKGAFNRACNAKKKTERADYWVGIEGGIDVKDSEMFTYTWMVVISKDKLGRARSGSFFLPNRISKLIKKGIELGEADDIVFGRSNSKQKNGAVGLLTGNVLTRTSFYETAIVLALIPFKNPKLY